MYITPLHCIYSAPSRILAFWLMLSVLRATLNKAFLSYLLILLYTLVAKPNDSSKFWGNHFAAFFDRHDSADRESRGCGAITPELSEKSKMADNTAATTSVNTVFAISHVLFMLLSQFWCLILCFRTQGIHLYVLKISLIFTEKMGFIICFPEINSSIVSYALMFWRFHNICNHIHVTKCILNSFSN